METLAEYMQTTIGKIGQDFTEPDDDWASVVCVDGEDGVVLFGLPGAVFANGFRKDVLAQLLRQMMVELKAYRYAALFNVHSKAFANQAEFEQVQGRIEHLEGAQEMLVLVIGDAEQEECLMAKIMRDGVSPPTLEEWQNADSWSGRFSGLNEHMSRIS